MHACNIYLCMIATQPVAPATSACSRRHAQHGAVRTCTNYSGEISTRIGVCMYATRKVHDMHNEDWSGPRVAAVLEELRDAGIPQSRMARLAGVNRSQVNRWSRGENRPGHDPVQRLAAAIAGRKPKLARELVEASGYVWTTPEPQPEPIPDEVLRAIEKNYPPEQQQHIIDMLNAIRSGATAAQSEPEDAGRSS